MGFYGNIGDTSHIHFQFDKIFSNRREMDLACANGTDGVYQGRFVLVKYDEAQPVFSGDILYGFINPEEKTSTINYEIMYADTLFEQPYLYTDYVIVSNAKAEDFNKYYEKNTINGQDFYIKLSEASQVVSGKIYYKKENDSATTVGINTIIYRKNIISKLFDGRFYICTGKDNNSNYALWKLISDYSIYGDYLSNFQIDAIAYGEFFDYRGYDATVWEKIYSEGVGKYIPIARLNSSVPAIEILDDKPTILPTSAYIDAKSSPELYSVHVPAHWGFQFKEAGEDFPSDQTFTKYYYDESSQELKTQENANADVYFNLNQKTSEGRILDHETYKLQDDTTRNKISIEPTGKSGKKYNGEVTEDTYELSVHLPFVGNMISKGYDLIYGENEPITTESDDILITRPRDVKWYNGNAGDAKTNGDNELGGKTYDLNTLAGTLNTMHTRLGQNIVPLKSMPDSTGLNLLSPDYIYYIEDEKKYYRLGTGYIYNPLTQTDYTYSLANISSENYLSDTYYTDASGTRISTSYDSNSSYYKKSIKRDMYEDVTDSLMEYLPETYFVKRGVDYFRDNADLPSNPNQQYYAIKSTEIPRTSFSGQYAKNSFHYKDENENYLIDSNDKPTPNRDYYLLSFGNRYIDTIFYQKNKFYKKNNDGKYILCDYDNLSVARSALGMTGKIYWLEFDETQDILIAYEENGETKTYIGHPLKQAHDINLSEMIDIPNNIENFYMIKDENNYIAFNNIIESLDNASTYSVRQSYVFITNEELQTRLYVTGKYYYRNNGSQDYILSYDDLIAHEAYYTLDTITPLTKKFYLPNTYYRETAEDYFEIDLNRAYDSNARYYTKERLFVIEDYTGRCPYGYEWSNYAVYVPASVTLAARTEISTLFELKGFEDGENSINGSLLQLARYLESENSDTRNGETYRGSLNKVQDYLYTLGRLIPNRILYVNDFGQLASSSIKYSELTEIMKKYEKIMAL